MVSVSLETPHEVDVRLRRVIRESRFDVIAEPCWFDEFPIEAGETRFRADALALVRDESVWSQLVPRDSMTPSGAELFAVWCFHFRPHADNSGFVGWLASHLKHTFGTGVFVTCGSNSSDGGIFDYWGCPEFLRVPVLGEISTLVYG
ncbi:MAG: DUF6196 family protein [Nocardioides sp.]